MKISKKKLNELKLVTVFEQVLKDNGISYFNKDAPETWSGYEKKLFDIATEIEDKILSSIIACLQNTDK
jgi:hypothetical protein